MMICYYWVGCVKNNSHFDICVARAHAYLRVHRLATNQQTARDVGEPGKLLHHALGLLTQLARRAENHGADAGLKAGGRCVCRHSATKTIYKNTM